MRATKGLDRSRALIERSCGAAISQLVSPPREAWMRMIHEIDTLQDNIEVVRMRFEEMGRPPVIRERAAATVANLQARQMVLRAMLKAHIADIERSSVYGKRRLVELLGTS